MLLGVGYGQKAITKSIDDVLRGREDCEDGWVIDCVDDDCCPISWIGDGYADCEDQAYGCDLTCYDNDGGDCEFVYGCTDPSACNYYESATVDNGNCYYGYYYFEDTDGDDLGSGSGVLYCPEDAPEGWVGNNFDQYPNCNSNVVDECGVCDGDSSSCTGCTDLEASNYDPDATFDDGSCYYEPDVFGCMYSNATNYNPDANVDDLSCEFMWGDINQDGTLSVLDVVALVNAILSIF